MSWLLHNWRKKNLVSACWWNVFLSYAPESRHKISISFMIRCTKIKCSKEDNNVQLKKGCCCLVAHRHRLTCVGSLKVLNNVTLWAPNLSLFWNWTSPFRVGVYTMDMANDFLLLLTEKLKGGHFTIPLCQMKKAMKSTTNQIHWQLTWAKVQR